MPTESRFCLVEAVIIAPARNFPRGFPALVSILNVLTPKRYFQRKLSDVGAHLRLQRWTSRLAAFSSCIRGGHFQHLAREPEM